MAVDGTFLSAIAEVTWAIANANNHGAVRHRARVDVHLNVSSWLPEAIVIPDPAQSEADSAIEHLQAGRIYIYDRGFMSFALLGAHYQETPTELVPESHFVMRFKREGSNSPKLQEALIGSSRRRPCGRHNQRSNRLFYFGQCLPHWRLENQASRSDPPLPGKWRNKNAALITNLLDVSATTIAFLYRHRWQVELFFRWFKSFGNFGHLDQLRS